MPRMAAHVYAAHQANVLKLARRKGGVSRGQIADELNVSRAVAGGLIKKAGLVLDHKDGRTEYYAVDGGDTKPEAAAPKKEKKAKAAPKKEELPPEVKEAAVAETPEVTEEDKLDTLAQIDAEIVDTRQALQEAAGKAGKALGEWATQQALVDAMRERMTNLAVKRMEACSE